MQDNLFPINNVEKIFCINVETNTERQNFMKKQFHELKINEKVEFVKAVTPESEEYKDCLSKGIVSHFDNRKKQIEQAISLSHRKVWKIIKSENIKIALVLEDDIEFNFEFLKNMKTKVCISDDLKEQIYYIHLLTTYPNKIIRQFPSNMENPLLHRHNIKYGMGAYIIGDKSAELLIGSEERKFHEIPIDDYLWNMKTVTKHRNEFILFPIICQNTSQKKTVCFKSNRIFKSNFRQD